MVIIISPFPLALFHSYYITLWITYSDIPFKNIFYKWMNFYPMAVKQNILLLNDTWTLLIDTVVVLMYWRDTSIKKKKRILTVSAVKLIDPSFWTEREYDRFKWADTSHAISSQSTWVSEFNWIASFWFLLLTISFFVYIILSILIYMKW